MKKAITPVISVILLIMLTVAITGGAWYWMTNVQGSLQEGAGSSIEQTTDLSSVQFSIASVRCNATGNWINATILNTGSETIAAANTWVLTVSSISGGVLAVDTNLTDANIKSIGAIGASAAKEITTGTGALSTDLVAGTSYSVKLSVGGSSQTATCTAS